MVLASRTNHIWSVWQVHSAVAVEIKTSTLCLEKRNLQGQNQQGNDGEQGQKDEEQVQQQQGNVPSSFGLLFSHEIVFFSHNILA